MSFCCGLFVPARRGRQIDRHAVSVGVEDPEPEFGGRIALLGGPLVPALRLGIIAFAACASGVHQTGIGLRFSHALFRRRAAPAQGFGTFLRRLDAIWEEQ